MGRKEEGEGEDEEEEEEENEEEEEEEEEKGKILGKKVTFLLSLSTLLSIANWVPINCTLYIVLEQSTVEELWYIKSQSVSTKLKRTPHLHH